MLHSQVGTLSRFPSLVGLQAVSSNWAGLELGSTAGGMEGQSCKLGSVARQYCKLDLEAPQGHYLVLLVMKVRGGLAPQLPSFSYQSSWFDEARGYTSWVEWGLCTAAI